MNEQGREGVYVGTAMHHGANIVAWKTTDAANNSTVTTRDAIHYDERDWSVHFTGVDAIRIGQRVGVYSATEAKRLLREMRAKSKDVEPTSAEVEATIQTLEKMNRAMRSRTNDERKSDEKDDPEHDDEDTMWIMGRIMSVADVNRAHRAQFSPQTARALTSKPIQTLADINARNRRSA